MLLQSAYYVQLLLRFKLVLWLNGRVMFCDGGIDRCIFILYIHIYYNYIYHTASEESNCG